MNVFLDILSEAAFDTLRLLPFLYLTYLLMEYLEDKAQEEAMVKIMLAHLSPTNNTPSQAEWTVGDILSSRGFEKNRDYSMNIALKEGLTLLE
ncbi:MAG: hypothetical protein HUJ78_02120 [Mogibacterium sp.]|nr:hypothetical protein [Mogibacterium sp.]